MTTFTKYIAMAALLTGSISTAHAYIGPGMGGGVIAAVLGIIGAVFIGLCGIVYYPVKRALKKKKAAKLAEQKNDDASKEDADQPSK